MMVSEGGGISMLLLRIIALVASVVAIPLVVTDKFNGANFIGEDYRLHLNPIKFQDIMAFRYVVAVAAISVAYGIIQLPFAIYHVVKHKRLIRNGFLPNFDFFGDKVISLVLATATGAGIGVSYERKRAFEKSKYEFLSPFPAFERPIIDEAWSQVIKFYERAIIASSVLAVACLCMAIVSVISSINRSRSK